MAVKSIKGTVSRGTKAPRPKTQKEAHRDAVKHGKAKK